MRRPVLLVDVDQVLLNLADVLLPHMREILEDPNWHYTMLGPDEWDFFTALDDDQRKRILAIMGTEGFCLGLSKCSMAEAAMSSIKGMADVYIVTSPTHVRNWVFERAEWLELHFGIPHNRIVHTEAKYMVRGDFFLDDHPDHILTWAEANPQGVPMLWTTGHNARITRASEYRVHGWPQVLDRLSQWR